jgi:hypothetical protein
LTDPKEESVLKAYALVGRAATGFSALEFHLQFLVSALITGKPLAIEAVILTQRSSFAQKIQLLRDFIPIRFIKGNPFREPAIKLAEDLDALREDRNLFIHGCWLINWQIIAAEGLIRCSDPKWRRDKNEEWKSMTSQDFPFARLEELIKRTISITEEVGQIVHSFEKNVEKADTEKGAPSGAPPRQ